MPEFFKTNLLTPPHLLSSHSIAKTQQEPENNEDKVAKLLLEWRAPARLYRKKDRSYYTTVIILVILISIIAFLAGEKLLIGAIFALLFVIYVLDFIPPEDLTYKLSTQGVTIDDHFYHWNQLNSFWITSKNGDKILSIPTNLRFPTMLILPLAHISEEEIKSVCVKYLPFQEIPPKSLIERWSEALQKHFPLEAPHK